MEAVSAAPVLVAPVLVAPVLVALPGTLCSPAVFEPLAAALAGEVTVDPVSWLTGPGPWDIPAVARRVARHIGARGGGPFLVLASQRDLDLTGELAAVTPPAIVVHGRYDRARPPEQGRELAGALPHAEFRLAEAGHTPVYETPEFVAAAVRDLIRATRPATP